jgi:hypothetical protein
MLRVWREAEVGVNLALCKQLHGLSRGMGDPLDILAGVQTHVGHDACEEDVLTGAQRLDGHGLALEVADRPHAL